MGERAAIGLGDGFDLDPATLRWDDRGLVTCVARGVASGEVLMVAWANEEAVRRTLRTREAHFWSRSREVLWKKGESSGNLLRVRSIRVDCDRDTLVLDCDPAGPACHTGAQTCFTRDRPGLELGWLAAVLASRADVPPEASYTARLLARGLPRVAQKVGEEATEVVVAALSGEDNDVAEEAADLLYHLLVLLQARGVSPDAVASVLSRRHAVAGEVV